MATFSTDGSGMPSFINTGGDNSGLGGGGGLIGTLLALSLLGRNGLGNGWGNGVDGGAGGGAAVLNSGTLDIIQQTLGDIKASVPLAEGQVQLALAQQMASLSAQNNANTQAVMNGQTQAAFTAAANAAVAARDACNITSEIARESNAIQLTVKDDGEKTRSLITANYIADLNSRNVILANEISDLKASAERATAHHGTTITMTNNQNQNQLQFQQQAQVLNQLAGVLGGMQQSIHATNQAINIGSGSQRSNPSNNNTNVTA